MSRLCVFALLYLFGTSLVYAQNTAQVDEYLRNGKDWREKKEYDKSLAAFSEAIRLGPMSAEAYFQRGVTWHSTGDYFQAIADYNESLRLDPKDAAVYSHRGIVWLFKNEYDKAMVDFDKALQLDPNRESDYSNRAAVWIGKRELNKAIADFDESVRLNPAYAIAYSGRGTAWLAKDEYDKAIVDFNECLRLDPKNAWAFNNRGCAWLDKQEYGKAVADFNECLRLDPKDACALVHLAWILATCPDEHFRNGKQALEVSTEACRIRKWKDSNSFVALAAAYAETGYFDESVKWLQRAMEMGPEENTQTRQEMLVLFRDGKPYGEPASQKYLASTYQAREDCAIAPAAMRHRNVCLRRWTSTGAPSLGVAS